MEKMLPLNQMESALLAIDGTAKNLTGAAHTLASPSTTPQAENYGSPKFVPVLSPSPNKRTSAINCQVSLERNASSSVSNCYFFKSRLQEYAQKAGIPTPVYETIKEGPSHEPSFRSTVIVNNVRYDSLPGFFNRKAAEQSAAEVALIELANSVDMKFGISQPVHETGLCKNLLQEYAQKMNYAIPLYECHKDEKQGRKSMYSCVLEIGGIKYIGASASTKKEAEIKVARTALLAIQSAASVSEDHGGNSIYTVIPRKRKVADLGISTQETAAALKPKKGRFKKQQLKKKRARGKMAAGLAVNMNGQTGVKSVVTGAVGVEVSVTDVASQVATAGGVVQVEASVTDVGSHGSHVETAGGLVPAEASVTDVRSEVETAGGLVPAEACLTDVGSQEVETAGGLVPAEACLTDVGSQVETAGGLVPAEASVTDVGSQVETAGGLRGLSVTNANSFKEPDSGLTAMERTSHVCTPESDNGNLENALVLFDEQFKDGGSTAMDMHP